MKGDQECYLLGWFRLQGTEILTSTLTELAHVTGNVGVGQVWGLVVLAAKSYQLSDLFFYSTGYRIHFILTCLCSGCKIATAGTVGFAVCIQKDIYIYGGKKSSLPTVK